MIIVGGGDIPVIEEVDFVPEEGDPVLYEEVGEWLHGCVLGTCVC